MLLPMQEKKFPGLQKYSIIDILTDIIHKDGTLHSIYVTVLTATINDPIKVSDFHFKTYYYVSIFF